MEIPTHLFLRTLARVTGVAARPVGDGPSAAGTSGLTLLGAARAARPKPLTGSGGGIALVAERLGAQFNRHLGFRVRFKYRFRDKFWDNFSAS